MSKKITQEIFLKRFFANHNNAEIEVINYKAITLPCTIQCKKCGKIYTKKAQSFINQIFCCDNNKNKIEIIEEKIRNSDFCIIGKKNKDYLVIKHIKCGNTFDRTIQSVFANPFSCKFCDTHKTSQQSSLEYAQNKLSKIHKHIIMTEYNGYESECKFFCEKCKNNFSQKYNCLLVSRGCPQCDRNESLGESFITNLLTEKELNFKKQYKILDLSNLLKFDFAVFDVFNNLQYLIEVQGDFHYIEKPIYESLEVIQERDNRKRTYCSIHKIPLYELKYIKGKFLNLDILPE